MSGVFAIVAPSCRASLVWGVRSVILTTATGTDKVSSNATSSASALAATCGSGTSSSRAHCSRDVIHSGSNVHVPSGSKQANARPMGWRA
jgi:hypothetical protein